MKLINVILKIYERWQDRRRFGKLKPLDHYCVHCITKSGEEISFMLSGPTPEWILKMQPRKRKAP